MSAPTTTTARRVWKEPDGIAPRGTLVVVPGRGETPDVYERFARRLSADAYVVVAVTGPAEAREVLDSPDLARPVVLVGTDTGASSAVELTGATTDVSPVDAVVLAGIATGPAGGPVGWEDEIAARTACPNHRNVLRTHATSGLWDASASTAVVVTTPAGTKLGVPTLAVHGDADTVSPLGTARDVYRDLGVDELAIVAGGLHDILNDVTHRSVAATVVLFLERLRADPALTPLVRTGRP